MGLLRRKSILYSCIFIAFGVFAASLILIWKLKSPIDKPPALKVIPLEISDYPKGWHLASIESDNDWHADFVYNVNFVSVEPYLPSSIDFVRYRNASDASDAYKDNRSRIFWWSEPSAISGWELPPDVTIHAKLASLSEIACTIQRGNVEICTFWAQYNKCLIQFTTQMDDKLMSHNDFEDLITTIDRKMNTSDICING